MKKVFAPLAVMLSLLVMDLSPAGAGILVSDGEMDRPASGVGLRLGKAGNSIYFHNSRRRRAKAAISLIEVKETAGGAWQAYYNPKFDRCLSIPSTQAMDGFIASLINVANGNYALAEVDSKPMMLPVPPGYKAARYRVTVLGTYVINNYDTDSFNTLEKTAYLQALAENYVYELIVPTFLFLTYQSLPEGEGKDALEESLIEFTNAMIKVLSSLMAKMLDAESLALLDAGDYQGYLRVAIDKIKTDTGMINVLDKAIQECLKNSQAAAYSGLIADKLQAVLNEVDVTDDALTIIGLMHTAVNMHDARKAELWEVDVTPKTLVVQPGREVSIPYNRTGQLFVRIKDNGQTSQEAFQLDLTIANSLVKLKVGHNDRYFGDNEWYLNQTYKEMVLDADVLIKLTPWLGTGNDTLTIAAYDWDPLTDERSLIDTVDVTVKVIDATANLTPTGYYVLYDGAWTSAYAIMPGPGYTACYYAKDASLNQCGEQGSNWWTKYPCGQWAIPLADDISTEFYACRLYEGNGDITYELNNWGYLATPYVYVDGGGDWDIGSEGCYAIWGPTPRCQEIMGE